MSKKQYFYIILICGIIGYMIGYILKLRTDLSERPKIEQRLISIECKLDSINSVEQRFRKTHIRYCGFELNEAGKAKLDKDGVLDD